MAPPPRGLGGDHANPVPDQTVDGVMPQFSGQRRVTRATAEAGRTPASFIHRRRSGPPPIRRTSRPPGVPAPGGRFRVHSPTMPRRLVVRQQPAVVSIPVSNRPIPPQGGRLRVWAKAFPQLSAPASGKRTIRRGGRRAVRCDIMPTIAVGRRGAPAIRLASVAPLRPFGTYIVRTRRSVSHPMA
jgi:hypothetical protein